ncbi:hypothetical protein FRB99_008151, partial [Tulasnella sp. 403]
MGSYGDGVIASSCAIAALDGIVIDVGGSSQGSTVAIGEGAKDASIASGGRLAGSNGSCRAEDREDEHEEETGDHRE